MLYAVLTNRRSERGGSVRPRTPSPLGRRIREARQALGLTLAQVAGKDFTRAFLNQVELGRAQPSMQTLRIIAHRLQQPIEYFLEEPGDSMAAIELALAESELDLHRGQAAHAEALILSVLRRPVPLELRTQAQLILAGALLRMSRIDDSLPILEEAIKAAERAALHPLLVELYDRMGTVHYLKRRPHAAAQWFDRAIQLYQASQLADPALKARLLGHRANLHYVAGQPIEAISAYQAAISSAEQVLDMPTLAGIYEGLALSFQQTGQYARALSYALKGLRIFETLRDVRMAAQLRHNMGDMLLQQGRWLEAERLFAEGAEHLRRIGDQERLPHLVAGMAESALEQGHLDEAATLAGDAIDLATRSQDPLASAQVHRVAGRVAHAQRRCDISRRHFERALALAEPLENPDLRARITYDYARALEEDGDAAGAALRFRQAYEAGRAAASSAPALTEALT